MPRNGAGDLADEKPWISMSLSLNGFTILTRVTFLAFGVSRNMPLMLLMSWLKSAFWIMLITHVWLCNVCLLGQIGVYFNSSETWLVEISVITITDANRTWCLFMYLWNTANGWILCWSKWCLVCVSLMTLHLICGQTNYYITVG